MSENIRDKLEDPSLFSDRKKGEYTYRENEYGGKSAYGELSSGRVRQRNGSAQRSAGGELKRNSDNELGPDDGGHLIRARFGGSPGSENLTAQNRNLNRGSYKRLENGIDKSLDNGNRVYFRVDTDRADRPNSYSGYAIFENENGERSWDAFSFTNESESTLEKYEELVEKYETVAKTEGEDLGRSFSACENEKEREMEY